MLCDAYPSPAVITCDCWIGGPEPCRHVNRTSAPTASRLLHPASRPGRAPPVSRNWTQSRPAATIFL